MLRDTLRAPNFQLPKAAFQNWCTCSSCHPMLPKMHRFGTLIVKEGDFYPILTGLLPNKNVFPHFVSQWPIFEGSKVNKSP